MSTPSDSASHPHIAIIGAGFSGTMTAVHLLRADFEVRITLIERAARFGPGLAYSTPSPVHYLNVPAGNMTAFDDEPAHFLKWAQERDPAVTSGSFLPRSLYGQYLKGILSVERVRAGANFREVASEALDITTHPDGRSRIRLASGETLAADRVVLALGNALPPPPPVPDEGISAHPAYIHNPWDAGALEGVLPDEPVLIIGSGLTMMDVVMSLASNDHAGHILAISRHGLLPRPHRSPSRAPAHRDPPAGLRSWDGSAKTLLHALRAAVRDSAIRGTDWRDVVTSIRSSTPALWQRMDAREKARFLSRLRSYWDIVRHRAAPETAAAVADVIAARRLSVRAARLLRLTPTGKHIQATFRPRGSSNTQTIRFARVINCMGPQCDVRRVDEPLIRSLLASGAITPDPHALGIETTEDGSAIAVDGRPSDALFVVGPLRRAQSWENTAVPELRKQAAAVARTALASIHAARR